MLRMKRSANRCLPLRWRFMDVLPKRDLPVHLALTIDLESREAATRFKPKASLRALGQLRKKAPSCGSSDRILFFEVNYLSCRRYAAPSDLLRRSQRSQSLALGLALSAAPQ